MFVLGLTGSIGMGKSAAATIFRRHNIPVYDADFVVHELLGKNGAAVEPVADLFEGVVSCGQVDRKALGKQVFEDALEEAVAVPAKEKSGAGRKFSRFRKKSECKTDAGDGKSFSTNYLCWWASSTT